MKITQVYEGGLLRLRFDGELDHHAARTAVRAIEENIDGYLPVSLILDLTELSFMDSSGIAVILKAFRRMNELGGGICVENVRKQPLKVLDTAGLGRLVKITALAKEA